jgi:hypothetical protein
MDGSAKCYLSGQGKTVSLDLTHGNAWMVRPTDLVPGRYTVGVLYDSTKIPPAYATFEIVTEGPPPPRARFAVTVRGSETLLVPGQPVRLAISDVLGALTNPDEKEPLGVEAPPGWPVRVLWSEASEETLCTLPASSEECVDPEKLVRIVGERVRSRPIGDLTFDAGELGRLVWPHRLRRQPQSLREAVVELLRSRGQFVQRMVGNYEVLLQRWFEPICADLGYELDASTEQPEDVPGNVRVCRLFTVVRHRTTIARLPSRTLVLIDSLDGVDLGLREWLDDLSATARTTDTVLSTGMEWAVHRMDSRLPLKIWRLASVVESDAAFIDFLRDVAVGV